MVGPVIYPPEYCAHFLTGEVDLEGIDSDRDGIGNQSDPDLDGDGLANGCSPPRSTWAVEPAQWLMSPEGRFRSSLF